MRPSRLVTYQVCRPGEGSVPGRPGLVVAVGTVTAAMATMTAAMTDCNICSLKKVCDEVEGIRQLHFGQEQH